MRKQRAMYFVNTTLHRRVKRASFSLRTCSVKYMENTPMVTIIGHQVQRRRRSQEIWWGGQNQARTAAAKLEMKNLIGFLLKAEFNFPVRIQKRRRKVSKSDNFSLKTVEKSRNILLISKWVENRFHMMM